MNGVAWRYPSQRPVQIVDRRHRPFRHGRGATENGSAHGFGIVGMRERVGLLRGHLSAGPRPEGGFRVTARLPLPEPVGVPVKAR